jgi:hypothetical protein
MHPASGVRRRPPPPRAFPTLEPDAPDALAEEAAALRERAHQQRNRDTGVFERELDWGLARQACGDSCINSVGPDLACSLCHQAECAVDCALRERTLLAQARYEWLLAQRDGCARKGQGTLCMLAQPPPRADAPPCCAPRAAPRR